MKSFLRFLSFLILSSFSISVVNGQTFTEINKSIPKDTPAYEIYYGDAVCLDEAGGQAVIGASRSTDSATMHSGRAYVMTLDASGKWFQDSLLWEKRIDKRDRDYFGTSVAIAGNYALVGAPSRDYDTAMLNLKSSSGLVYAFQKGSTGWPLLQKIMANDRDTSAQFGAKIVMSGNTAFVAAPSEDFDSSGLNYRPNAGAVYQFELISGRWVQVRKISMAFGRSTASGQFGELLSLKGDVLVISSGGSSVMHIYRRQASGYWQFKQKIDIGRFDDVAVDTNKIIVGNSWDQYDDTGGSEVYYAGAARIYEKTAADTFVFTQKLLTASSIRDTCDYFGRAVAICGDYAVVGSLNEDISEDYPGPGFTYRVQPGSITVFKKNTSGVWTQLQRNTGSTPGNGNWHGAALSMNSKGTIIAGAPRAYLNSRHPKAGAAFIYQICSKDTGVVTVTSCDTFKYSDSTYKTTGTYYYKRFTTMGCDSVVKLTITINKSTKDTVKLSGCDSIRINGTRYDTSGLFKQILSTASGCDSNVFYDLKIYKSYHLNPVIIACDSFIIGDTVIKSSGIYTRKFVTVKGCDSIITVSLSVYKSSVSHFSVRDCERVIFNGVDYTASGNYLQKFINMAGCDSNVFVHVLIDSIINTIDQNACDEFTLNGTVYTSSGNYIQQFARPGCDSFVSLNLKIIKPVAFYSIIADSFVATGSYDTYQWYDCEAKLLIPGATGKTYWPSKSGSYAVIVSNELCFDTSFCRSYKATRIEEGNGPVNAISIYPNPADETIKVDNAEGYKLIVQNMLGAALLTFPVEHSRQNFNISQLPAGQYILRFSREDLKTVIYKIMKL